MPRRTSGPKPLADDAPLPPGWIRHDGGDCPVPADSRPGFLFRSGSQFQAGARRADSWGSMWQHSGSIMDVIAYLPE